MDIILTQDVDRLGKSGEVKKVKNGYARNFLFPSGLAVPSTASNRRQSDLTALGQLNQARQTKEKALALKSKLQEVVCTIPASVGEQGKLHGAVTSAQITQALEAQGISLGKHQLLLERPVTRAGQVEVAVKLHPEVTAVVKVSIVPQ